MNDTLRALLAGIIDYAGIFPPSELPLDDAMRNFADYRAGDDAWMLARFICPAARLAELDDVGLALFSKADPTPFSVVTKPSESADAFLTTLAAALDDMTAFRAHHGTRVVTDAMEIRLPADPAIASGADAAGIASFLEAVARIVDERGPETGLTIYLEGFFPDAAAWTDAVPGVVAAIAQHNERTDVAWSRCRPFGYKVRTGGVTADAFPTCGQVALVIDACRRNAVPFKATAGLHHPVRHFAPSVDAKMHGFLNVFVATVLAHANDLGVDDVARILESEDAAAFRFEAGALGWGDWSAPEAKVVEVRRAGIVSYGSCSFDEPREDLAALGLM